MTRLGLSRWQQIVQIARDRTRLPRVRVRRALTVRGRPQTVVVLYHRIVESPSAAGVGVVATRFAEQLRVLQQLGDIIPLAEVVSPAKRPRIAVTFDDGYSDNYEIALPLLERQGIPATFFVTTAPFDDPTEFWWDRLEHLLLDEESPPPQSLELEIERRRHRFDLSGQARRVDAYQRLNWALLYATPHVVEQTIEAIERACGRRCEPCSRHTRMSPSQTRAAAEGGVASIGAHTVHHHCLSALRVDDARGEIEDSRSTLADLLGAPPSLFAYPFGDERSFGRRDSQTARAAGFDLAVAAVPSARISGADRWRFPRFSVGNRTPEELRSLLRPFLG